MERLKKKKETENYSKNNIGLKGKKGTENRERAVREGEMMN